MSHIVTATLEPQKKLRVERVKPQRELPVPSGFTTKSGVVLNFKDAQGDILDELLIKGTLAFDLDVPHEKHNWNALKIFCMLNKEYGRDVVLIDKEDENQKAIEFDDLVFQAQDFLRSKKNDYVLLQKIYRRLKGLVEGITEVAMYRTLLDHAKTKPEDIIKKGIPLIDHENFEMEALIDISIERGNLLLDHDGTIKKHDGTIYAKDHEKAAYQLKLDDAYRMYLQRAIDSKGSAPQKFVFKEEDSELAVLLGQMGMTGEGLLDENANKSDETVQDTEDVIELHLNAFVSSGLVQKTGQGAGVKYTLVGISDNKFSKKEFVGYLAKNYNQYEGLKLASEVK